ncbi:MAG: phage tail protein [Bryobacteraceae bacterium]
MEFEAGASFSFSFNASASASASIIAPAKPLAGRQDPYLAFRFAVEIEGLVAGGFSDVEGLQVEIEVEEYREGGLNGYTHKRAGPAKHASNLSLKRGLVGKTLSDWCWDVVGGTIDRKNISVVILDETGEEQVRWNFEQAFPVKWVGPQLKSSGNEIAVETLELVHKGFVRTK